MFKNCKRMLTL